jgi:hypothetical protein
MKSVIRAALLVAGISTYLIFSDDVVWRFIKTAPHARLLEHLSFGIAAAMLGLALLLKIRASADASRQNIHGLPRAKAVVSNLLQAIGIGFLLPLPGFLLLVFGEIGVSLLQSGQPSAREQPRAAPDFRRERRLSKAFHWGDAVVTHIGLCCAFISMIVFSVVLIDRVADVLFAMTAVVSTAVGFRDAWRAGTNHS